LHRFVTHLSHDPETLLVSLAERHQDKEENENVWSKFSDQALIRGMKQMQTVSRHGEYVTGSSSS